MKINEDFKYKILWYIGTVISFLLYYSGLIWIYSTYRTNFWNNYRKIVLTYHRVRDDHVDPNITVSEKSFREQINFLLKHFPIVSVNEIINSQSAKGRDEVVITFDDGYRDNYDNAYPLLKEKHLPAMIFPVTNCINTNADYLVAQQTQEMSQNQISFGSHTGFYRINHIPSVRIAQFQHVATKFLVRPHCRFSSRMPA